MEDYCINSFIEYIFLNLIKRKEVLKSKGYSFGRIEFVDESKTDPTNFNPYRMIPSLISSFEISKRNSAFKIKWINF